MSKSKPDIHDLRGQRVERLLRNALPADVRRFLGPVGSEIAASERAKARERRKRARRQAETRDLFND